MWIWRGGTYRRKLLAGIVMATAALLPSETALALTVEEVVTRFEGCGFQIGEHETVRAVDGRPTTFFRVWHEHPDYGTRGLVIYVYPDTAAADSIFHALSTVESLEGVEPEPTSNSGPVLVRGTGRSVWRENVAVAQIVPLTSHTDLDAVPDVDLIVCLDYP